MTRNSHRIGACKIAARLPGCAFTLHLGTIPDSTPWDHSPTDGWSDSKQWDQIPHGVEAIVIAQDKMLRFFRDLQSKEQQPEPKRPQLPKVSAKGLLTKSHKNYHVVAEKLANESFLLSEHPVCKNDSKIAEKMERHYAAAVESLESIGGLVELWNNYGRQEDDPSELGLLVLNEIAFTNIVRHMKEVYHIASTPALDEARAEMKDRVENLIRLRKKHQAEDLDFDC